MKHLMPLALLLSLFNLVPVSSMKGQNITQNILPEPTSVAYEKGMFLITPATSVYIEKQDSASVDIANYFIKQADNFLGIKLSLATKPQKANTIVLKTGFASEKKEAYLLTVKKNQIVIDGTSASGLFYGVQTLLQMMYPSESSNKEVNIPCCEIKDEPAFAWRGMHLDVGRHFFPVPFIKKMIDQMAMLKLNRFHWHLTEDQGWRIEIKRYPKLTEIGAWRDSTLSGKLVDNKYDGIAYGGFYTQEQIKEVVTYAQKRFITIVPEIEMPGHAVAALTAYPQFSCTGGPFAVRTKWGISEDVYCAGKEETFEFIENILDEVCQLFPGKYLHIGGDECPKNRWKTCPVCQKRMKDEGLNSEAELQSYFIKRIEKYVASKGKSLVGWDEILQGGLPERATVMSWRGKKGAIKAAQTGHDVIMTPMNFVYFDYFQTIDNEPFALAGPITLDKVYSFNPIPSELSAQEAKHILGAQGNVWTEYISNTRKAEYMIFPRLCALSEVLWTPKEKQDYKQFLVRLGAHAKRLQKMDVYFHPIPKE